MRDSIMEDQNDIIRKSDNEDVGMEDDNKAVLDDVGYTTRICI